MTKKIWKVYKEENENLLQAAFRTSITKFLKPGDWIEVDAKTTYFHGLGFSYITNEFPPSSHSQGGVKIRGFFVDHFQDCYKGKTKNKKKMLICSNFGITVKVYNFAFPERNLEKPIIRNIRLPLINILRIVKLDPVSTGIQGLIRYPNSTLLDYVPIEEAKEHGIKILMRNIKLTEENLNDLKKQLQEAKQLLAEKEDIEIPKVSHKRNRINSMFLPKVIEDYDDD